MHIAPTQIVNNEGRLRGLWRCPLPQGRVPEPLLATRLLIQNFISVPAYVFRRDAYQAVGGMDPALWYTADWDLWVKLGRFGPCITIQTSGPDFECMGIWSAGIPIRDMSKSAKIKDGTMASQQAHQPW